MRTFKLILFFLLIINISQAQDEKVKRYSYFMLGFNQVKESANIGLAFKGPALNYGLRWQFDEERRYLSYENQIGIEILFTKEMPALGFYFKPAEFSYMFKIPTKDCKFAIGPSLKFEYNYNYYPELQAGFDYWFTNFSLGINSKLHFQYKKSGFQVIFNTSFIGFTSRQPADRGPYYYDLGFTHAIKHLHQDLTFGTVADFNTTNFEIFWTPRSGSRLSYGYGLDYYGYYSNPPDFYP